MSNLTSTFDESRQLPEDDQWHLMRAEYYIQMHGCDGVEFYPSSVRSAYSDNVQNMVEQKKRDKQNLDHAMIALSNRLKDIENRLIDKYGEYFAENLAAEHLEEDIYEQLMLIQDQEERRGAIAAAINDAIENGSIDVKSINENPDLAEWLSIRSEIHHQILLETTDISEDKAAENIHKIDMTDNLEVSLDSFLTIGSP